jgi:hypothetical protein
MVKVMHMKKAQGLSLNMMAIAVMVLIALAVVLIIFKDQVSAVGDFFGEQTTCKGRGGECVEKGKCSEEKHDAVYGLGCPDDPSKKDEVYCCLPIGKK